MTISTSSAIVRAEDQTPREFDGSRALRRLARIVFEHGGLSLALLLRPTRRKAHGERARQPSASTPLTRKARRYERLNTSGTGGPRVHKAQAVSAGVHRAVRPCPTRDDRGHGVCAGTDRLALPPRPQGCSRFGAVVVAPYSRPPPSKLLGDTPRQVPAPG
jgi:hypothetical protein